jgi:hypothetical protein
MTKAVKTWEAVQLERAVLVAKTRWGHGWRLLGADIREALVRAEVLAILAQAATAVAETPQGKLAELAMHWPEGDAK